MSEPVTIERLERALRFMAGIVTVPEWQIHLPIFERLEREVEAARNSADALQRARQLTAGGAE